MLLTHLRLPASISPRPLTLNAQTISESLLPPLPLYRRLLRAHRALPGDMRSLGDNYVKSEFRRHKETTNPVYVMGFLAQWKMYLDEIESQAGRGEVRGRKLDPTVFEHMTDEQIGQLYEVMHASRDVWKPTGGSDEGSNKT